MTTDVQRAGGGALQQPTGTGLADALDTVLDKGIVIDAYVQASVVGIDILTLNARVVVASVDTYLRFAEAVNRLDLTESKGEGVSELVDDVQKVAGGVAKPALETVGETLQGAVPELAGKREAASRAEQPRGG